MAKTAIIIGATGLTGNLLTNLLLKDDRYSKVRLISRSSLGVQDPKLEEHLVDMFALKEHSHLFLGDELFCCIGTTKSKTPDESLYRKIDFEIPVTAAELCKAQGVKTFVVMSSLGANPKSSIFYSRLKGEMEAAITALELYKTIIVRPSLISGKREEHRTGEQFGKAMMRLINPLLIGPLRVYRSIAPESIAKAMIWLANSPVDKQVFLSNELIELSKDAH